MRSLKPKRLDHFLITALLLIVFIGGFLRFYNLNWDESHSLHPDERNIIGAVGRVNFSSLASLNPEFFAYGGFPIYFYRAIGEILGEITHNQTFTDYHNLIIIGRGVSAFLDTVSILLIFLISLKLFDRRIGLLTATFFAFTPYLIQISHFSTTESMLIFLVLLITYFAICIFEIGKSKDYLISGILIGLAIATKVTGLSLFLIIAGAHFGHLWTQRKFSPLKNAGLWLSFFSILPVAFFTTFIFSPYYLLGWNKFTESMRYEGSVALGKTFVPYTLQFENTIPYLFQLKNITLWLIGPPFGFLAVLGIFLLICSILRPKKAHFIILPFVLVYLGYVGFWYAKFIRYLAPILPFFIILGSKFLVDISDKIRLNFLRHSLIFLIILSSALYSVAFFNIYLVKQSRIVASRWIYVNIPQGAKIYTEHWDDGLPLPLRDYTNNYQVEQLIIYGPDNQEKINYYAKKLSEGQYIILSSRRLWGTLINSEKKYPITSQYYKLLFSGNLGYWPIAKFSSYPQILGLTINDDGAEETFQVYDHPTVYIFKNINYYSLNYYQTLLRSSKKY